MPRSDQPGGVSRQMHVRYTARRKLGLLTAAERLQREEGMFIQRAAEELLVAHSLISLSGRRVFDIAGIHVSEISVYHKNRSRVPM